MSKDTIYREDAIDAIHREARLAGGSVAIEYADMFQDALKSLPSADRPQGEWIDTSEWYAPRQKCSICETIVVGYGSNFCPNCGCRMKGADDERS